MTSPRPTPNRPPFLSQMSHRGYVPARPFWFQAAWYFTQELVFASGLVTSYGFKRWLLRKFGAQIADGVLIKPRVRIKYPWELSIGADSWVGEGAWIDNFVRVTIGANACVSQGAYLCTGNHDWSHPGMDLVVRPIAIEDGAWVGAFAKVAPGVIVRERSIVTLGSVALTSTEPDTVYGGSPALPLRRRVINDPAASRPIRQTGENIQ